VSLLRRGLGLPMAVRMSGSDAAMIVFSALVMAIISSIATSFLVYQASLSSTPPISIRARAVAVHGTSELIALSASSRDYLGLFSGLFSRLYMDYFWVFLVLASILSLTSVYPFLVKVYSQLPVLMYRVGLGPLATASRAAIIALVGGLPVTVQPFLSYFAVVERYGLSRYIGRGTIDNLVVLGLVLLFLPGVLSLIYLVSGRLDASLLSGILVAVTSYELVLDGYWIPAFLLVGLVVVAALYPITLSRWHGVRRG